MLLRRSASCSISKLLAEHGAFSRARRSGHVTQPTLSAGIQELEKVLGAPVVDRARSGVILTAVGEEAVRRARDAAQPAPRIWCRRPSSAGQPLSGRFRLGVIPTVAPFLLADGPAAAARPLPAAAAVPARGPDAQADRQR